MPFLLVGSKVEPAFGEGLKIRLLEGRLFLLGEESHVFSVTLVRVAMGVITLQMDIALNFACFFLIFFIEV